MANDRKKLITIYGGRYSRIYATDPSFWNVCYYCGDIANEEDHVPPISTVEFFDISREPADYFLVPCCRECNLLGSTEPHGLLDERADYIREKLKKKNRKKWRQSQLWTKEEVDDFYAIEGETSISRSLKAIVDSEDDLKGRLQFKGYSFEVRGSKRYMNPIPVSKFSVFGASFDTFKEALHYSIEAYKTKADLLYKYAVENNGNLQRALNLIFIEQEERIKEREIEQLSKEISEQFTKPKDWVYRTIKTLKSKYPDKTNNEISKILIEKYINRKNA